MVQFIACLCFIPPLPPPPIYQNILSPPGTEGVILETVHPRLKTFDFHMGLLFFFGSFQIYFMKEGNLLGCFHKSFVKMKF